MENTIKTNNKNNKKYNVIVIGSSGFIGRNIFNFLFARNNFFVIPVFFNNKLQLPNEISFNDFIKNDIDIDYLIVAAGNSSIKAFNDFNSFFLLDSQYLKKIFQKLKYYNKTNGIRIIYFSSTAVYHGAQGLVTEENNIIPSTNYGLSKFITEKILLSFCEVFGINCLIFRLSYAFGNYEKKSRFIPSLAFHIKNNSRMNIYIYPESYLNPLPVEFICEIVYKVILHWNFNQNLIINLSYKDNVMVKDILNYFKAKYGLDYDYVNSEINIGFYPSTDKLLELTKILKVPFPNFWESVDNYVVRLIKEL